MLVLARRVGETLMIGDEVTVTILGIKGNQVKIGVSAPKEMAVHREEIYERIKADERTMKNRRIRFADRRQNNVIHNIPFRDSDGTIIKESRRKIPDRRISTSC